MHTINLAPLFQQVVDPVLVTILTGLAAWVAQRASAWLGAHAKFLDQKTDATLADGFNRALQNGVSIAMNQLDQFEGRHDQAQVKSWVAAKAGQYAINHSPDFVQRFTGMTPEAAAEKALAYLPVPAETQQAVAAAPSPSPEGMTEAQERAFTDGLNAQSLVAAK